MRKQSVPFLKVYGRAAQAGMSLIEIIIVIALIGVIMGVVVTNVVDTQGQQMDKAAELKMNRLGQNLQRYYIDMHRFPTTEQGLDALLDAPGESKKWRGPYAEERDLEDPWGNRMDYEATGRKYRLISAGSDGEMGTEDDVKSDDAEGESES